MSADQTPGWIRHSGIGVQLAGVTAGFALIGYWIDGRYGTSPWGILGGVVLGLVGGLYNLVRESLAAVREAKTEDAETAEKSAGKGAGESAGEKIVTRYVRFLGLAFAVVIGICALGWVPTRRLAGPQAASAMATGCAISLLSAAVAGWLLIAVHVDTPQARMQRAFLAMMVRLALVLIVGVAVALSGEFARSPLLFWLAAAYMALLPLEVRLAIL